MRRKVVFAFVLLLCALCTQGVYASAWLTLSDVASNGDDPAPDAALMDASFEFSVSGSELTLVVTNLTPEGGLDPELSINEVYFNARSKIEDLVLTEAIHSGNGSVLTEWGNWDFAQGGGTDGNPHQVDGFGKFDLYLKDGTGPESSGLIGPYGESVTFIFDIIGDNGPYAAWNFIELSNQVDDHTLCYGAAHFQDGLENTGFGGTTVPEPATICLLGLGGLVLMRRRRK